MDEQPIFLELTPAELRLMLKIAEANDQADGRRRIGSMRTRTTLMAKLYTATDSLGRDEGEEETEREGVGQGGRG